MLSQDERIKKEDDLYGTKLAEIEIEFGMWRLSLGIINVNLITTKIEIFGSSINIFSAHIYFMSKQ